MSETAIIEARRQAIARLAHEAAAEALNARIMARRAADPDDPRIHDGLAHQHHTAAEKAQQSLAEAAKHHGTTSEQALADIVDERRESMRQQLEQWRNTRAVHQDYLDHPELYGGRDLGGRPLQVSEQQAHVKAYDAAIAETEAELGTLG